MAIRKPIVILKIKERRYRIRRYGWNAEASVDESKKGLMRYVGAGGTVRHQLMNQRRDVCDTWVRGENGGMGG
jgi:hypothetical protein